MAVRPCPKARHKWRIADVGRQCRWKNI